MFRSRVLKQGTIVVCVSKEMLVLTGFIIIIIIIIIIVV